MPFTEDLSVFFNTEDFATAAMASWGGTVNVIFDAEYLDQLGMAGTNPGALAMASEVPASAVNGTITINGTAYTIRDRQPQDDGAVVLLQLERA